MEVFLFQSEDNVRKYRPEYTLYPPDNKLKVKIMMDYEEQEITNRIHTQKARWCGASIIRETETTLVLSLPAARKIRVEEVVKGVLSLIAILGFLIIPFFFTPEYVFWGILLALAVLIPTGYQWLYLLAGRDELEIDSERIQVRYGIGIFKKSWKHPANEVQNVRCTATTYQQRTQPFGPSKPYPSYVWVTKVDTRTSAIACDINGETVSLLGWIEKPLAKQFIGLVKRRFAHYND